MVYSQKEILSLPTFFLPSHRGLRFCRSSEFHVPSKRRVLIPTSLHRQLSEGRSERGRVEEKAHVVNPRSYSLQSASGSASRSCSGTIHDLCMNTRKSGRQWGQCHLLRSRNDSRGGVRIHRFFQLVVARRSDRAQRRRSVGDLATGERRNGLRKKVRVGPCKRERMR